MCGSDIFLGLIAILFPPLAVWVKRGICSVDSLINIALCCLGFLPGLLHAWYIISITPDPTFYYSDVEGGNGSVNGERVTYYYVQEEPIQSPWQQPAGKRPAQGYGTINDGNQGSSSQQDDDQPPPAYHQVVAGDYKVQGP